MPRRTVLDKEKQDPKIQRTHRESDEESKRHKEPMDNHKTTVTFFVSLILPIDSVVGRRSWRVIHGYFCFI